MTNILCAVRWLLIHDFGINYQQAGEVVLVTIRTRVGLQVGGNIGNLHYARENSWLPL
ncbi:MAG: EipA family protein [Rhodospirillales bacterium]